MKRRVSRIALEAIVCAVLASGVRAEDAYVSGLLHQSLGDAQLGAVTGRTLAVSNIGSSGEDGVEIRLDSAFGGDAAVDLATLLATPGAECRIRPRGWDGLIYGNHRIVSNGDGTATIMFDFSGMGATEVNVVEYDENGLVIYDVTTSGPSVNKEWVPNYTCPDGSPAVPMGGWRRVCPTCPWFYWIGWACPDGSTYTYENQQRVIVTPTLPSGTPDLPGVEALSITASGVPELAVSSADLGTFGVQCWGLGQAQVSEQCDAPPCTPEQLLLAVDNLGSSGQDGVSLNYGPNAGGQARIGRCPGCPPGHVIIMKLYDEDGGETFRATHTQDPGTGDVELTVDSSGLGAAETTANFYDSSDALLQAIVIDNISGISMPLCPAGYTAQWIWNGFKHIFVGCSMATDFVLPDGSVVTGVAYVEFEPVAPLNHRRSIGLEVTSDDPNGITVSDVAVTPFAAGDLDCDGAVNNSDIPAFVMALTDPDNFALTYPGCSLALGDITGDGQFNNADIPAFVDLLIGK